MASPPPQLPQSALTVADPGATAAALGANASPQTARAPAATDTPVPNRLPLMESGSLSVWGELRGGNSVGGTVSIDAREAVRDKVEIWPIYRR
ncbi:hypothetical protein GCM10010297_53920 [Streptomyces malachitofuscus]|nr:hypothetical protein GCM10010297_53920 [Streptomyces malachitofuscus]